MIHLSVNKGRDGALFVIAETTSAGAGPYEPVPVHREEFRFGLEESVSEVGVKVFEWVAEQLERQA